MIIQIRGTSGSGKSTIMRQVMEALGTWRPWYVEGRKRPWRYNLETPRADLTVLGHYESQCGGCDTIGSARQVYDALQEVDADIVLCEGLLLSEDVKWSSQLRDLHVLFLTTSLERCLSQIQQRRKSVGNDKPLNAANTTNRVAVIERARLKLLALGVDCRRCSPNQAKRIILKLIERRIS